MQISLQALGKKPTSATFTFQVHIWGKCGIALVDSGSSHTFMDMQFAAKTSCTTVHHPMETVMIAGGGQLQSGSHIVDTQYTIQGHKFSNSFKILPLKKYDIILGCDWLNKHSPITMDFDNGKIIINLDGKTTVSLKDNNKKKTIHVISLHRMEKLTPKGVSSYCLLPAPYIEPAMEQQCAEVEDLLQEYKDVFAEPKEMPPIRSCDHAIPLKENSVPPMVRPYRIPHKQKDEMEKQVKELLDACVIRPSESPYASPAILVRKKDGTWRMCIDYRKLNSPTVKNKFPIHVIEDLFDELYGANYFTKLDLRAGYHQVRMKEEDIHKTTFRTYFGHYEYLVMPFGLTNAPATFQSLMNKVFAHLLREFILVFFDDILIYSRTLLEHLIHLREVLELLRQHKLFAKASQCIFAATQVEYLGHIISGKRVETDPKKIEAVKDWPTPKNSTQLRGFLGLAGYYEDLYKIMATSAD